MQTQKTLRLLTEATGMTDADVEVAWYNAHGENHTIHMYQQGKYNHLDARGACEWANLFCVPVCFVFILLDESGDPVIEKMKELVVLHIKNAY